MTSIRHPLLQLHEIVKDFGQNRALDHVDFTLERGEIHALLGENGAGKSTLMNIVRGMISLTAGSIDVDGKPVQIRTATEAADLGIGMVHQHFLLVPVFTVAENLMLAWQRHGIRLDQAGIVAKSQEIADQLGWSVPWNARIADLPVGTQQRVEITRALLGEARILLFDEPTAVLTPSEALDLFAVLRALKASGKSIVFVSHKLDEVMAVCDQVTVLRRGKVTGNVQISETNVADLAMRMVGQKEHVKDLIAEEHHDGGASQRSGQQALVLQNVSTRKTRIDEVALRNVSFSLQKGEIVGVAGVDGNGQTELFEVLAGLRPFSADRVEIGGAAMRRIDTRRLQEQGVAVIPPDRQRQGLALGLSVRDNLVLGLARTPAFHSGPLLNRGKLRGVASKLATDHDVRSADLGQSARSLSGGNQQKIVIARALAEHPKLIIAASPTRGLDVAATAYVHESLRACRKLGVAVLLISTELEEILALSDRIAVMYEGRIVGIVGPDEPREKIGIMMGGSA